MALVSPEPLAGLECSTESRFWISTVDVRDAVHRMALPDDLSDCFALVGTAQEFSVCELNGDPLEHLWPCCQCLPMGFSLAVYLAQQATTAAVVEATGIAGSELFHDRQVNLSLGHRPWVLFISTTSGSLARTARKLIGSWVAISHELCLRGLLTHELCLASRCCDLGIEVDGEKTAHSGSFDEIREIALGSALGLGVTTCLRTEVGTRHETCDSHISGASDSFICVCGGVQVPAGAFSRTGQLPGRTPTLFNAMPLLESNWSLSWSGTVMATDVCEDGYGVVSGKFPPSVVSAWERRLERHRFWFTSAVQWRKHALAELDPFGATDIVDGECEGRAMLWSIPLRRSHCLPCGKRIGPSTQWFSSSTGRPFTFERPVHRSGEPFVAKSGTGRDA